MSSNTNIPYSDKTRKISEVSDKVPPSSVEPLDEVPPDKKLDEKTIAEIDALFTALETTPKQLIENLKTISNKQVEEILNKIAELFPLSAENQKEMIEVNKQLQMVDEQLLSLILNLPKIPTMHKEIIESIVTAQISRVKSSSELSSHVNPTSASPFNVFDKYKGGQIGKRQRNKDFGLSVTALVVVVVGVADLAVEIPGLALDAAVVTPIIGGIAYGAQYVMGKKDPKWYSLALTDNSLLDYLDLRKYSLLSHAADMARIWPAMGGKGRRKRRTMKKRRANRRSARRRRTFRR
jgi:hypothetical protein